MIKDIKSRAIHRSKIIQGQMRAVQDMIENEDYCMDILTLELAIQKSLSSLSKLIVENHIETHIEEMMRSGDETQIAKAKLELSKMYELTNVRGK